MTVSVSVCEVVTPEIVEAITRLLPQLSRSAPPPTAAQLEEIVTSPTSYLLVVRVDGQIVGSLTLVVFRIPTGVRAWIEDVVVDEAARGTGVGEALNRTALAEAQPRASRPRARPASPPTASTSASASSPGRPTSTAGAERRGQGASWSSAA